MENLHVSNLDQTSVDKVGSDLVLGPDAGYQEALFTLPPNSISTPDRLDNRRTPPTLLSVEDLQLCTQIFLDE
jgi:hypothetical protein